MPDLGKYAEAVLSSYALSLLLIAVLVAASIHRARRVKRELREIEERMRRDG
ncbi:MAG: hypothetical protein Kow0058_09880 [Roseovarius sp.]